MKLWLFTFLLLLIGSLAFAKIVDFELILDPSIKFQSIEYYQIRASKYKELCFYDNAVREIQEGLSKYPTDSELYYIWGQIAYEQGNLRKKSPTM